MPHDPADNANSLQMAITRLVQSNMNTELQIVDFWKVFLGQLQQTNEP